jgi:thiol-disulfide isomerase/thioredoxin
VISRSLSLIIAWLMVSSSGLSAAATSQPTSQPESRPAAGTVEATYPGLAGGVLTFAVLGKLPEGTLLESGTVRITQGDLDAELAKAPAEARPQLARNAFFFLEQVGAQKVILDVARREAGNDKAAASRPDRELMRGHFERIAKTVSVTDAEVKDFYENNKDACGGATLEQMKGQLRQYVQQQKEKAAGDEYTRTLGKRVPIRVSADWTAAQAVLARDNPVDKARLSGKPSMVDFGASGCRPCDMMAPILKTLESRYEHKANILFVHVREQQVLGARYGIEGIPSQVFFDKDGREVFRHVGFYPADQIERQLAEMGVK